VTHGILRTQGPVLSGNFLPGRNTFGMTWNANGVSLRLPTEPTTLCVRGKHDALQLLAVYPDGSGTWAPVSQLSSTKRRTGLGAAAALADLDGQGPPELLTSAADWSSSKDEVRLYHSMEADTPSAAASLPGPALVMTPAKLDGKSEQVVVGIWLAGNTGELWRVGRPP
jgi:hypothetical protein